MERLAGICGSVVRCDIFKSFFLEAQTSIVIEEIYIINKLDHSIKRLAITMAGRPAGRPSTAARNGLSPPVSLLDRVIGVLLARYWSSFQILESINFSECAGTSQ